MSPAAGGIEAKDLPSDGRYRFVEFPTDGVSYQVVAFDTNTTPEKAYILTDRFVNKRDALIKLNKIKGDLACEWTTPDSSRFVHIEDHQPGAVYEDLSEE